jgi:hypothetical protein
MKPNFNQTEDAILRLVALYISIKQMGLVSSKTQEEMDKAADLAKRHVIMAAAERFKEEGK